MTDKKSKAIVDTRNSRAYTNVVDTFSPEIKVEINERIFREDTLASITEWLKTEHNISIHTQTLARYRAILMAAQSSNGDITTEREMQQLKIVSNKRDLLESLIADAYKRLQDMKKMHDRKFDPQWEKFINDTTESIRKLVETMSKLNEELDNDSEKIDNIVKRHLTKVMKAVYETIKQICPEKSMQFQQVLQQKYTEISKQENS